MEMQVALLSGVVWGFSESSFMRISTVDTSFFFFFQAEDGIRDLIVTGVQTCALPISARRRSRRVQARATQSARGSAGPPRRTRAPRCARPRFPPPPPPPPPGRRRGTRARPERRGVGKRGGLGGRPVI